MIRALILALLPLPAFAGGLAPETAPRPIERPHYAPIMEPVRCKHIPWTMCATGEPESRPVDAPETPVSRPEPETPVEKPEPEKPESPCKRKLGGGC